MSTCSGKCCAVFNFPRTPEELLQRDDPESQFIGNMLIPLDREGGLARCEKFEIDPPEGYGLVEWLDAADRYTCRHWDEDTRLCGVYEERPRMCRDYPYDKPCQHDCNCDYRPEKNIQTAWAAIHVRQAAAKSPGADSNR